MMKLEYALGAGNALAMAGAASARDLTVVS